MFDLLRMKIKSPSRTLGRLSPSPPVEAPIEGADKRSDKGGSKPSRKKMKVIVSKLLKNAAPRWASKWAHRRYSTACEGGSANQVATRGGVANLQGLLTEGRSARRRAEVVADSGGHCRMRASG
ncbi:hypothetical protein B296_00053457 [Ensete ventricosum]|uniref:Uncharacterized protein n=1 Tax=Ensete ventricosum TaxID=4639 RepID=A0A426XBD6_ENSVE|nr:hypothetical protein B296_00053457 [Ensete ventricosum]